MDDRLATRPRPAHEALSRRRFRLTVDPASPVPNFADAGRIRAMSMLGRPRVVDQLRGAPPRERLLVVRCLDVEIALRER